MRYRPLVALLAGTVVPIAAREILDETRNQHREDQALAARSIDNVDHADHCPHDNLLRCLIRSPVLAYTFCSWSVGIYPTPVTVYSTVTLPPLLSTTPLSSSTPASHTPASPSATSPTSSAVADQPTPPIISNVPTTATVTVTQTTTDTLVQVKTSKVTLEHTQTQTTTDTLVKTISVSVLSTIATSALGNGNSSTANNGTYHKPTPTKPLRFLREPLTTPKTSLECLDDLQPTYTDITSACSCFSSSQMPPTTTATITAVQGAPTCRPGGQPTFPNCFNDFHPYNCGTDHVGQIACSCVLTTEGTGQCTLGDYERDNACTTSDDCAQGWYCTAIDCFGDGVPSVCTKACPVIFAGGSGNGSSGGNGGDGGDGGDSGGGGDGGDGGDDGDGGDGDGGDDDDSSDYDEPSMKAPAVGTSSAAASTVSSSASSHPTHHPHHHSLNRSLSIIIINKSNGIGSGRAKAHNRKTQTQIP